MTTRVVRRRPAQRPIKVPDSLRPALKYVEEVLSGKEKAGELVRLACERHVHDAENQRARGLYFDERAADLALRFFPQILQHSKGEWAGQPLVLRPWQSFRIASIFGWKLRRTKLRRFRQAYNSVARKNGKALALDTLIPTPGGWRTMGDLEAGDLVFDETGAPTRVTWVSPVMIGHPCFEVEFSTGDRVVADAEHLWLTSSRGQDVHHVGGRRHGHKARSASIKTTLQIAASLDYKPGERNHRVPVAGAVQAPEGTFIIDPYVLGAWLGDGSTTAAAITSADAEIIAQITAAGEIVRKAVDVYGYLIGSGVRGFAAINENSFGVRLRSLGVYGNKHIPEAYLFASIEQRTALLQGLMDTDGYVSRAGQCTFYTTDQRLADDTRALIASLGFKPSIVSRDAKIGPKVCGTVHAIQFWAYADRPVFRLSRKLVRQRARPATMTRTGARQIIAVRPVASVPVCCIAIEAASKLYLCSKGFIPTHNTLEAAGIGLYMLSSDNEGGAEVFSYAPLSIETLVPTPTGFSTMGSLDIGDHVFDETGKPCCVVGMSPIYHDRDCFEVLFSDGSRVVADAEHLWRTSATNRGNMKGVPKSEWGERSGQSRVRTTAEIAATLHIVGVPGRANHRIPLAAPLQLPEATLPIDPYVLGVWLGDGTSRGGSICYHDTDSAIADNLIACGVALSDHTDYVRRPTMRTVTVLALRTQLRLANLLRNKHVPAAYLRASISQRLALLQGLFDTDGTCTKAGECRFTNRNHAVALAVVELAAGLGMLPRTRTTQVTGKPHYNVCVRPKPGLPIFRLPRKQARVRCDVPNTRNRARYIIAVNPIPSVPVRCIAVDSPNHLFLVTERCIATHNTKVEQAKIVFNDAKAMIRKSPALKKRLKPGISRISYLAKEGFWAPLSRDKETMDGLNPHLAIADELHAHKTRDAYDVIDSAFGARRQPLHWVITTRGANQLGICGELDDYSSKILRGEVHDDSWFAYIACLDDGDEWDDEEAWKKANPNLNISVKIDSLRDEALKARHMPSAQNEFRRKRCNLWTQAVERWIDFELWQQSGWDVDDELLVGRKSWWGLDMSGSIDLTALVGVIEHPFLADHVVLRCRFWLPEENLEERAKKDRVPYRLWVEQGWLETTPGATIDRRVIAHALAETLSQEGGQGLAYDRWHIKDVFRELDETGFACQVVKPDAIGTVEPKPGLGMPLVEAGQGFKDMAPAVNEFERLLGARQLGHGGNPILTMCSANAVLSKDDAGNRKWAKNKAVGRIDGIVAASMAVMLRKRMSADKPLSVYEQMAAMNAMLLQSPA